MSQSLSPIPVPWSLKPLESAASGLDILDDGRLHLWIRHDVVHGVTPEMLVWWFQHLEGDMELEGVRYPRYRVWHPRDHVGFRYARLPDGGTAGPGARFHIHERFAANPAWEVDVLTDVVRLDAGGFAHRPRILGGALRPVAMDYAFTRVPGGTRYENSLTVGLAGRPRVNALLRARVMPEEKGRAWLRHNVEEVGAFEEFLPLLMRQVAGR